MPFEAYYPPRFLVNIVNRDPAYLPVVKLVRLFISPPIVISFNSNLVETTCRNFDLESWIEPLNVFQFSILENKRTFVTKIYPAVFSCLRISVDLLGRDSVSYYI